jgi:hypothetical protein
VPSNRDVFTEPLHVNGRCLQRHLLEMGLYPTISILGVCASKTNTSIVADQDRYELIPRAFEYLLIYPLIISQTMQRIFLSILAPSTDIKVNATLTFVCICKCIKGYLHLCISFNLYRQTGPERGETGPRDKSQMLGSTPPRKQYKHINIVTCITRQRRDKSLLT